MFAGEEQSAGRHALEAGDGRELAGLVAGVTAARQRVGRPVLEMRDDLAAGAAGRRQCAGIDPVEVGDEQRGFDVDWNERGAAIAARVVSNDRARRRCCRQRAMAGW